MNKVVYILFLFLLTGCERMVFDEDNYNTPVHNFEVFWKEFDRNYAFFEYLDIDWDSVYRVYRPMISNSTGEAQLFAVLSEMANIFNDEHVNLFSDFGVSSPGFFKKYRVNVTDLDHYLENITTIDRVIRYSKIKNHSAGYVQISSFSTETDYRVIDRIIQQFAGLKGIIIDVRSNGGGNSIHADTIASRFADASYFAFRYRYRNGPKHNDFTAWEDFYLNPAGNYYEKPVVVLTNRFSYSATEWFVSEMRVLPQVTIVGDTTGGGSGNPLQRQLPNGWMVRMSNSQKQLPEGYDYQFTGITPDVAVWISREDSIRNTDTILEKAISIIESK